ncbi:hypothetical protein [Streptomyces parvus]|uniref:hypothetical protein n=1 Tax=Streptomyces parvus TaxID=66428 RepID=UPI0035D81B6D
MALAAMIGADKRGTPLDGIAFVFDALAVPSGWTEPVASWIAERAGLVGGMAQISLSLGLLALPRPRQLGWDLGQTMEWRSPSASVLSVVLMMQCGHTWSALITFGSWAVLGLWMLRWSERGYSRSDHVLVALGSLALAAFFAPLLVCAWFFGRDWMRKSSPHVGAE